MAVSRPNKLSVNWIRPVVIENKISETNYMVQLPGKRSKSRLYHINLLKPYYKRVEHIKLILSEKLSPEVLEADWTISYPSASPEVYDLAKIVRNSGLEEDIRLNT